jgi:solute carrier family 36 (proton-coupled amino acid transporter)
MSPSAAGTRTYAAGEDTDRLASAALEFGLNKRRASMKPVRRLFANSIASYMHAVGQIGNDERIDDSGTLHHYVSVRRRKTTTAYGTLEGLFNEPLAPTKIESTEEEEEELIEVEDTVEGGSLNASIFGIVKSTVGPAILYLPHGFQTSGYVVAIPAMIFATLMYIYNAYRLLDCWKLENARNHQRAQRLEEVRALLFEADTKDQDAVALKPTLLTYPELARRALGPYSFFVELGIASMQYGVCLTYLIFVPQNLRECTLAMTGKAVPKVVFLAIMLLVEIPLCWITDIRKLTPTNVVATALIAYGLSSVLVLAFIRGLAREPDGELVFLKNFNSLPAVTNEWFIFIGTSFFMMEGSITLLVPLQEAVYQEADRAKFPRVNQFVTTWIVIFYVVFSIFCVSAFGEGIRTAMTASLSGPLATSVQFSYSIAVILTFPLQAFPAMQVACRAILGSFKAGSEDNFKSRSILATLIVLLLGIIAVIAIEYLGNVVSVLGSLFGIPLALVFPPLMHNSLIKDSSALTRWMNYFVVGIGFFAMFAASYATSTWLRRPLLFVSKSTNLNFSFHLSLSCLVG